jgi:hypothetical protein
MIQEARAIRGLPFCDEIEMRVQVAAWARVLDGNVPDADLDAAFTRAVRALNPEHNLTPSHVAAAYEDIARLRFAERQPAGDRRPRPGHSGLRPGYTPGPVEDSAEMNRILTPEENAAEFAYWSAYLEERRAARSASRSGLTQLEINLPRPEDGNA